MLRNTNKVKSIWIGIFILLAYGVLMSGLTDSKILVLVADSISGLAVMGIAILMFPFFAVYSQKLSLSYLTLKIIEGALMIAGGFLFLNNSLQYLRDQIYNGIHVYIFIVSGLMFYYLLYISKLVPRYISIWGSLGILSLLVTTILPLVGLHYPILDVLLVLIITNEVFLAIWLMIKGIKTGEIK